MLQLLVYMSRHEYHQNGLRSRAAAETLIHSLLPDLLIGPSYKTPSASGLDLSVFVGVMGLGWLQIDRMVA